MSFWLAISGASCPDLVRAALAADARVMPVPGPARIAWQRPTSALLHWGPGPVSAPGPWPALETISARTGLARIDPVYIAEPPGAVVIGDRASWVAAVAGRLADHDPVLAAALLNLGFPLGDVTPYRGVRALGNARQITAANGRLTVSPAPAAPPPAGPAGPQPGSPAGPRLASLADALVDAVAPLRGSPVDADLTGGKDSRLIAAALTVAKVPFRARTYGAPEHPDVITAAAVAARLGVEHVVTTPAPPATVTPERVLARVRAAALVADGMLSAFENTGYPDPEFNADVIHVGGHGGELLRGGYAPPRAPRATAHGPLPLVNAPVAITHGVLPIVNSPVAITRGAVATAHGAARFRRLSTGRLSLLRPAAAAAYLAALAPWLAAFAHSPNRALDDFYLVNRAGRWSASARQAYSLRERLCQPFFADHVLRAARDIPLRDRVASCCYHNALACLAPDLLDIPLAGRPPASTDWRRSLPPPVAEFLRGYVLDQGSPVFGIVSKPAAERAMAGADPEAVWALATLAARLSGDWLNARSA